MAGKSDFARRQSAKYLIRKGELLVAGPLDIDDDMQRMVLRNGEATAKGGHALQWLLQLAETR